MAKSVYINNKKNIYILISLFFLSALLSQDVETLPDTEDSDQKNQTEVSLSTKEADPEVPFKVSSKSKFKNFFSNLFRTSKKNKSRKDLASQSNVKEETQIAEASTSSMKNEEVPYKESSGSKFTNFFSNLFNPSLKEIVSLELDSTDSSDDRVDTDLLEIQEVVYAGKDVLANAGADIAMPPGSWVILDASESTPKSEFLTYEWSFPPDFLFKKDYSFGANDDLELYEDVTSENHQSIKKIITQNKYIEIELPNKKSGSKFSLNLKVKSEYGKTNESSISVLVLEPIEPLFNNAFSYGAIKDSSRDQRFYDFYIESEINEFARTYGDSSIHSSSRPNQIALNKEFLSIQPLNKQNASLQEIELINSMIFNQCKTLGIKNVLDPNRKISPSVQTKKYIQKSMIVADTLIALNDNTPIFKKVFRSFNSKSKDDLIKKDQSIDSISFVDEKKVLSIPQLFKAYKKEDANNYYSLDSTSFQDTLEYEELEDLTLVYNSNCLNDSCGAENAILEGVGQLLTWSIDESSEISFQYTNLAEKLKKDPQWIWRSSLSGFETDFSESIKPSDVMMDQGTIQTEKVSEEKKTPRVYLSQDIYAAVEIVLSSQIMKKRNFVGKIKERNQKAMTLVKKKPIIFAVSVAVLTQGVSMLMKGEEDSGKDLPPGFPPI